MQDVPRRSFNPNDSLMNYRDGILLDIAQFGCEGLNCGGLVRPIGDVTKASRFAPGP
jgi:hypothetical protein